MAEVRLKNVKKRFGKTEVVHGVDLTIKDGEFVVFVGPSGCGKSTLLRMIAGLEEITEGEISIAGKVVNDVPPKDRDLSMVFQNYALYPHMSVYDNMSFGLKIAKKPKDEIEHRVTEATKILDIDQLRKRKPSELSGGQRQRVAMGRTIVRNSSIFLFDEPLSNLDAKLRTQMRIEIKQLHRRIKATVIYVTHDQIEAMTLGDRIIVLKDGYIEQIGQPIELFQNPINTFVAGFIGNPPMNLIDSEIDTSGDAPCFKFKGGLKIPIPQKADLNLYIGQKVLMGLRTEDFIPAEDLDNLPDGWKVEAFVEVIEPLGSYTFLHVDIQGVKALAQCDGRKPVNVGDKIRLVMNLKHLHIFDSASRKSIY
jgi:multiple sugar transport system ATP-binding protein